MADTVSTNTQISQEDIEKQKQQQEKEYLGPEIALSNVSRILHTESARLNVTGLTPWKVVL